MSENSFEDAARALESRETLRGSFSIADDHYPLEVQEPTLGELDELEAELGADAGEEELIRELIDRYLVRPEIDATDTGISKLRPLFEGMQDAFQGGDVFDDAEDAMPLDQGNG
jgi:hypothetical protein